jgi:hypothetical protein
MSSVHHIHSIANKFLPLDYPVWHLLPTEQADSCGNASGFYVEDTDFKSWYTEYSDWEFSWFPSVPPGKCQDKQRTIAFFYPLFSALFTHSWS